MTRFICFLALTFSSICACAQFTQASTDSAVKYKSKAEIRRYILQIEPQNSEAYQLARHSRFYRNCSYAFYGLSGAMMVGSIINYQSLNSLPKETSIERSLAQSFGPGFAIGSALSLGLGVWQSYRSKKSLEKAIRLHNLR